MPADWGSPIRRPPELVVPAPGLQEYHYPYQPGLHRRRHRSERTDGQSRRLVRLDCHPILGDGARSMTATIGHGLPMTYFKVAGGGAQLTLNAIAADMAERRRHRWLHGQRARLRRLRADRRRLGVSPAQLDRSNLAGKNYYTVAVLPTTAASSDSDRTALAAQFGKYAYAMVTGTEHELPLRPGEQHVRHHLRVHHQARRGHRNTHRHRAVSASVEVLDRRRHPLQRNMCHRADR